jgi:hypothetical protein
MLHRAISAMVQLSFRAHKTWIEPLRFCFHLVGKKIFKYFRFRSRHFEFPNFGYIGNIQIGTTEFLVPENLGRALEISFLSHLEADI